MTSPYKRVGRGGAGNFHSEEVIHNSTSQGCLPQPDLESQSLTPSLTTSSKPPAEYLHTGRGGAGNWAQSTAPPLPTADSESILPTSTSPPSTPQAVQAPASGTTATYRGGRGGAGNYSWEEGDEERKRKEEEGEKEKEVRKRVVDDVDMRLAKPGRAVVVDTVNRVKA
ncbi:uncharacterized protein BP5553_00733 [Venustampulla echinocandica]|uniref:Uncharacterized protein n=1 Tax=Venustampulla echinocandica TaxID=2656787 RepID=A0A370TZ08_9HELO|nr:uncharacterized protein BP5553_00733 [Venustampulla echinocandica]RDL40754.1 hypothetical protein BP5553_00733 [Venustampulla echinocandica]